MKKERAKHMAIPFVCLCLATAAQAAPSISKVTPPREGLSPVVQNDTQTGKKRVEGRVVDDKNAPLPGVSVTSAKTTRRPLLTQMVDSPFLCLKAPVPIFSSLTLV